MTDEPVAEPDDADDEDAHVPPDLLELHEVLEWQKAVADSDPPEPPKRSRKPKGDAS